jgi:hypothetical protein
LGFLAPLLPTVVQCLRFFAPHPPPSVVLLAISEYRRRALNPLLNLKPPRRVGVAPPHEAASADPALTTQLFVTYRKAVVGAPLPPPLPRTRDVMGHFELPVSSGTGTGTGKGKGKGPRRGRGRAGGRQLGLLPPQPPHLSAVGDGLHMPAAVRVHRPTRRPVDRRRVAGAGAGAPGDP